MNKRRPHKTQNADDFHAARARLKDIGQGLGSVFETVSRLIDQAADRDDTNPGQNTRRRPRAATAFDVRVGTVDDVVKARPDGSEAKPMPRASAQPKNQPPTDRPIAAESFATDDGLMVIVTLGNVPAGAIDVVAVSNGLALRVGQWRYQLDAPKVLETAPIMRVERNGFLTLSFAFVQPPAAGPGTYTDTQ